MKSKDKLYKYFQVRKELKIQDIEEKYKFSRQYIHRLLLALLEEDKIFKMGKAPNTIYKLKEIDLTPNAELGISKKMRDFLALNFIMITEIGAYLIGLEAFEYWCKKRKLPIKKTLEEYFITSEKYNSYKDALGLISGIQKLSATQELNPISLEEVWYLDFYAIERFGKTKLGTLVHYAKQGQSMPLINQLIQEISPLVRELIATHPIDAIAFVPPTVKRKTQLMDVLKRKLKLDLPIVPIQKIDGFISVPQKSLQKIEERINNANHTFRVKKTTQYNNLLLIDDAVGSGATLNQISKKIIENKIAKKVYGLALVGSYKGFDVITEV
jgi:hypothetical protein